MAANLWENPMSAASAVGLSLPPADPLAEGRAALKAGDLPGAIAGFHALALARPTDPEPRYWLSSALAAAGETDLARQTLAEARDLHAHRQVQAAGADMARFRDDKAYCAEIGMKFYGAKLMAAAGLCLGRSLDFDRLDSQSLAAYGLSLQHQGRMDEAIDVFTLAATAFQSASLHEFLLYALFHAPDRLKRLSEESREWARRYADPLTPADPAFANARRSERRLRIGYVAPSFTRNQTAQFIGPVLEAHDPEAVDVFLYCADPAGEAPLPASCTFRKIGGLADDQAASLIRADEVDILVDLWGHNAGSRLSVFARRPAPVQVAWINFVQTTGLSTIDYVLHADSMAVPGTKAWFTEEIWSLGEIMVPFRPAADRPDPAPTPALRNGFVTYGCFNNPAKLSDASIAAWAAILKGRPQDRLVLKYSYFEDPVLQRATQARFAAHGADPAQLEFRGHSTGLDYLREFQDIDLALDPSPCPGGTTTCDALSNGVPVLTLKGEDFYARIGLPCVLPCGLSNLVAESWDDYVARALALTAEFTALDALRARTRSGFDASAYRDEAGFTRRLEGVYRRMFERWLATAT
jgi:predicted O-linked N-acetylglucosamine transferase (SPINDLY family)